MDVKLELRGAWSKTILRLSWLGERNTPGTGTQFRLLQGAGKAALSCKLGKPYQLQAPVKPGYIFAMPKFWRVGKHQRFSFGDCLRARDLQPVNAVRQHLPTEHEKQNDARNSAG